jgi:hypothetical protein
MRKMVGNVVKELDLGGKIKALRGVWTRFSLQKNVIWTVHREA